MYSTYFSYKMFQCIYELINGMTHHKTKEKTAPYKLWSKSAAARSRFIL